MKKKIHLQRARLIGRVATFVLLIAGTLEGPLILAQQWIEPSNTLGDCRFIVSSREGSTFYALNGDNESLVKSTNGGATWSSVLLNTGTSSISSSGDGSKIILPPYQYSTNGGGSFSHAPAGGITARWSEMGNMLVSAAEGLYITTNNWASWSEPSATETGTWGSIALAADGRVIVAAPPYTSPGQLFLSTNSGASWNPASVTNQHWCAVACTADGSRIIAGVTDFTPGLLLSYDSGRTWTYSVANGLPPLPPYYHYLYTTLACSSDGSLLVANANNHIYISRDFGLSWLSDNTPAGAVTVAMSADGTVLAASSGYTFVLQYLAPPLYITASASQFTLSWPAPSSQYTLQQISDLASTNWLPVTNALTVTNYRNQLTLPAPTTGNTFYRLNGPGS